MRGLTVGDTTPAGFPRVVLVTGVSRRLGGRLAWELQADPRVERVIGVDVEPPASFLGRTEFVRVDIRTPAIATVVESAGVDTVAHVGLVATPGAAGGRAPMKEINVIGTMQLLAACQRAPTVRRLVARSTTMVYGSSPRMPAVLTEDMEPETLPRRGYAKDAAEVESYLRGLARRRPDVSVTTLRFANFMGPGVDSPLTRYLSLPVVPTVLGFDPRLQFIHEDDGLEALRRMTMEDHPGTFNVSGAGVMMLSQAIRRAGRTPLPVPAQAQQGVGEFLRRLGIIDFSAEQLRLLSHGRVVNSSALAAALGWGPSHSTASAFEAFVTGRGLRRRPPAEPADYALRSLRDLLAGGLEDKPRSAEGFVSAPDSGRRRAGERRDHEFA